MLANRYNLPNGKVLSEDVGDAAHEASAEDEAEAGSHLQAEQPIKPTTANSTADHFLQTMAYFIVNGVRNEITIQNIYFVNDMDQNLLSFAKVTNGNKIILIGEAEWNS